MFQDLRDLITLYHNCTDRWLKGELGSLIVKASVILVHGQSWNLSAEEANFVIKGKKIDAVRAFRLRVGCTLVEAKNAVEASPEYRQYQEALQKTQAEIF